MPAESRIPPSRFRILLGGIFSFSLKIPGGWTKSMKDVEVEWLGPEGRPVSPPLTITSCHLTLQSLTQLLVCCFQEPPGD